MILYHGSFQEVSNPDLEHSISDYLQVNGEYVLTSSDEAIEQKKAEVRAVRNQYLEQTDKFLIADYPITDEERELYKQYRTYLRDYTLSENWWESNPLKFEEWNKPKEPDPSGAQEEAGN